MYGTVRNAFHSACGEGATRLSRAAFGRAVQSLVSVALISVGMEDASDRLGKTKPGTWKF